MAAKKHAKTCAYRGQLTNNWTDDHVIPDCMWGDRDLPNRLVTVRTCSPCNGFWSVHEGYFRSVVAMMSNDENPQVKEIVTGDVVSHFMKDAKFRRDVLGTTKQVPTFNEIGLFTGLQHSFKLDWNRWDTVIGKIVRGMVYFDLKKPLPHDYVVQSWRGSDFMKDEAARHNIDQMSPDWSNMGPRPFASGSSCLSHCRPSASEAGMVVQKRQQVIGSPVQFTGGRSRVAAEEFRFGPPSSFAIRSAGDFRSYVLTCARAQVRTGRTLKLAESPSTCRRADRQTESFPC